jgi:hypothetical protein
MAYFAQLDDNNVVLQVISVNNSVVGEPEITFPQTEILGQAFILGTLKLPGTWKQTSYNNNFRGTYAGIGYTFDSGVFIAPQPYPSWSLDDNHDWQPPVPRPEGEYLWNEDDQEWQEIPTN